MKVLYLTIVCLMGLFSACSDNMKNKKTLVQSHFLIKKVNISINEAYYNSIASHITDTAFVILHEDNNTMFSDIDKIIEYNGLYYILDRSAARTVISFTKEGRPVARYGQVGQGPGEYVFPWDIDIDTTGIYVLDTNSKKIIHYNEQGAFLKEKNIPFFADAFKRLENGNFIFNITPDGKSISSLCLTDSMMNPIEFSMPYQDGYVGGCSTSDIFRNAGSEIYFYRSPSDTLITLGNNGELQDFMVFDFLNKSISPKAKIDYLAFRQDKRSEEYLRLVNTPIAVSDSIWVGLVEDGNSQYTIIFNPLKNKCGGRKFTNSSSVYDIIEPISLASKGNIISLVSEELANKCSDYNTMPDTVRNALSSGNRILLIHKFSF